jgi:hypothetical protein
LSGLPPVNRFTPTQIINGAILTCTSASGTASATSCAGPQLNGMDIRNGFPELIEFCTAVAGDHGGTGTGSGVAADPHFIWTGSSWALSSASANRMVNVSCVVSASAAPTQFSTRRIGKKLKITAR